MSVFDDEAKRLRREAEIEQAERAIVEAADKWRGASTMPDDRTVPRIDLAAAVDAWRKLKGEA